MKKAELIAKVSEVTEFSKKDAGIIVDAVFEVISTALQNGDTVKLNGFGSFEVRERAARKGRNPQTGDTIDIPSRNVPVFKPSKTLKDSVK